MRKVRDVVLQRNKPDPDEDSAFSSINFFLGAELANDGKIILWAESTDDYDWQNSVVLKEITLMVCEICPFGTMTHLQV